MSKQIYIDSNGNEVQVSGTVNSADMMPMSASDATKVSAAIGNLNSGKADKSSFAKKETNQSSVSVGANTINTVTLTVNNAVFGLVVGFYISGDAVVPMQVYFSSATQITVRVKNTASTATTCNISVFYI